MLVFSAACHAVYPAACARGDGGPVLVWYVALAGAIHASARGERACVERARLDERRSHCEAEANGKEDADNS